MVCDKRWKKKKHFFFLVFLFFFWNSLCFTDQLTHTTSYCPSSFSSNIPWHAKPRKIGCTPWVDFEFLCSERTGEERGSTPAFLKKREREKKNQKRKLTFSIDRAKCVRLHLEPWGLPKYDSMKFVCFFSLSLGRMSLFSYANQCKRKKKKNRKKGTNKLPENKSIGCN